MTTSPSKCIEIMALASIWAAYPGPGDSARPMPYHGVMRLKPESVSRARHRVIVPGVVALAVAVSGCRASRYLYTPPSVTLQNVMLNGVGLNGGALKVSLVVRNPNFYPLSTAGLEYTLLVRDSVVVAQGVDSLHRRVPSHDSTVVDLPVDVNWRGLSAAGSDIVTNGLVTYRLVGDIRLDTPVGVHRVAVDQIGRFAPLR